MACSAHYVDLCGHSVHCADRFAVSLILMDILKPVSWT